MEMVIVPVDPECVKTLLAASASECFALLSSARRSIAQTQYKFLKSDLFQQIREDADFGGIVRPETGS